MADNAIPTETPLSQKLPLNARRTKASPMAISPQRHSSYGHGPNAMGLDARRGNASSFARATSLLSQPSGFSQLSTSPAAHSFFACQKQLQQHQRVFAAGECSTDAASMSTSPGDQALERAEVARRVKRHLVTRQSGAYTVNDDGGYIGDTNEDEDDEAGSLMAGNTMQRRQSGASQVVDPFQLPSGDMTYQIYRWQGNNEPAALSVRGDPASHGAHHRQDSGVQHVVRRQSFSGWDSDSDWNLAYRPNQINVPGGFRRQFVRERAERLGRASPGILAETFVDFIALYGHFAGGNYLSDDDEEYLDYMRGVPEDEPDIIQEADPAPTEHTPLRRVSSSLNAKSSNRKAFFLVIKAFVGTGVLVLPRAFYNGGLLTSCLLMFAVAWYAWHCILLLADVYLKVGGGSYSDIGLRLYGRWMQYAVTTSIVMAQIGGCCAYAIFVAQNWRNVFDTLSGCRFPLSTEFWILVQMLVFIPLAWIRQIRYFAPVALVANLLIILSLGYLLGFDLWSIAANGPAPIVNYNPARFPLLVGTAVYSFEGVTLVIPIIESLKEKRDFPRVLTPAIMFCLGLFLMVGSLSYLTFGESVEAVVLLNLPNSSLWTMVVQLLYSIAILFSMPLQLFPAAKIMEAMMFTRSGRDHGSVKWWKNAFRTGLALFIALIAIFGADQLDNVVSLVGSFCLVPLSFIYPASMHLKAVAESRWVRVKDWVLIVVGVFAMFYVTFISITTWGSSDPPVDMCSSTP
ncbi:hypothetical protein LPJ66_000047 [Kickxella alabastrina]|uniref:Uncharacterized protein n=1 Tax=Kickxella alabastrina TaxID=61397 RepID=A0ACC1IX79_9FUNG|nr:hypothetical protein LPJ66_000047 [Kickxella alabastrina]